MKGVRHLLTVAVFCFNVSSFGQADRSTLNSSVIIDTKGIGFHFTDPTKGDYVSFDLKGDGKLMKVSWPQAGSGNMWLVLVAPSDTVTSGKQLFGNYSPHSDADVPNYPNPNGFNALNWWDKPQQGGAGHLIIDSGVCGGLLVSNCSVNTPRASEIHSSLMVNTTRPAMCSPSESSGPISIRSTGKPRFNGRNISRADA